ncbi:hypothetical protein L873DRAFT_780566 [Choiromyces venosus 120613-1]|uniref:Uncharacterized protein n=1 Tax=Choiromyces venosus 120613-1 TaxID=1336337 RepID=A0A3N4IWC8_9PEZI|nr:hypothetical protein L873DRAFT_1062111 [Choiromyces venosus 120613-1]RPB00603.1 hypothetical protein L873DRAFT_780566 [Choiromyces venosus 120613-1]
MPLRKDLVVGFTFPTFFSCVYKFKVWVKRDFYHRSVSAIVWPSCMSSRISIYALQNSRVYLLLTRQKLTVPEAIRVFHPFAHIWFILTLVFFSPSFLGVQIFCRGDLCVFEYENFLKVT